MADYIRTVHQAYLSTGSGQPPGIQGQMALLHGPFTVVAAGVRNLHVIATAVQLPAPTGKHVAIEEELGSLRWTVRFYDPVVLPELGLIDEHQGPAGAAVRRALGLTTHLYHLIVQPGSQLTGHHAGHAGAGLAMDHIAAARDFESIRASARGREVFVDEFEGAAQAGLWHAQGLLAQQVAPADEAVRSIAQARDPDPAALRKAVLAAVRTRNMAAPSGPSGSERSATRG